LFIHRHEDAAELLSREKTRRRKSASSGQPNRLVASADRKLEAVGAFHVERFIARTLPVSRETRSLAGANCSYLRSTWNWALGGKSGSAQCTMGMRLACLSLLSAGREAIHVSCETRSLAMLILRAFCTGAVLGAGATYFFDPRMGLRRRIAIEDRLRRISRQTSEALDVGLRDLGNRGQGVLHAVGCLLEPAQGSLGRRLSSGNRKSASGPSLKWSPGPRLVAATCGTALMANCLARRTPRAVVLGMLGFGLFTRALSGNRAGVEVHKAMKIAAPVDRVFNFFSQPENYLRISDVITSVEILGDEQFAKTMTIAGVPVRFEERFVRRDKDHAIETHSTPASAISYCKQLRFESLSSDCTRLHLNFHYHPPGGIIGHALATALGIDAKTLLGNLLMRAKYFLETGGEPRDAVACRKHTRRPATAGTAMRAQTHEPAGAAAGRMRQERLLHGPGAPTEDVHRMGMSEAEQATPWPVAPDPLPEPAERTGRFPSST